MEIPPNPNVAAEDRTVPGPEGEPDITVRIYRPAAATGPLPGIYFIHGGGMILGSVEGEDADATSICDQVGAVVVSVEYRLAPEHPHPAPVEDCYAGLAWMARQRRGARHRPGPAGRLRRQRRAAAWPSPRPCWPATAASRRCASRCRSTR